MNKSSESLRLAATMSHQLSALELRIETTRGRSLRVARCAQRQPDLTACELRHLVVAQDLSGSLPESVGWILDVDEVSVEGHGVRNVGDNVVAVELSGTQRWCWPTFVGADELPVVLGDVAIDALESGRFSGGLVDSSGVTVHVDNALNTSLVVLAVDCDAPTRRIDEFARELSRGCAVAEVLESVTSSQAPQ